MSTDSIFALSTPWMPSGVAVIRMSGPQVPDFIHRYLSCPRPKPRHAYRSSFSVKGQIIDEGLWIFFPQPHSYTGEDILELYPHGSLVVIQGLLDEIQSFGFRPAREGEFTERAFLRGKIDLSQAEAVKALIDAVSLEGAYAACASVRGYVRRACDDLEQELLSMRVHAESMLDFSDEDVDPSDHAVMLAELQTWIEKADRFLHEARLSSVALSGVSLMLLGEPNVGKSSLMNGLSRSDVSIVNPQAGTTRDIVRQDLVFASRRMSLMDTAGIRETECMIEHEGIRRIERRLPEAHCVLWVLDVSREDWSAQADRGLEWLAAFKQILPVVFVMNKIDACADHSALQDSIQGYPCVRVSCVEHTGYDQVMASVVSVLGGGLESARFYASVRQVDALSEALLCVKEAVMHTSTNELFAEDLARAHRCLMSVLGYVGAEDVLGSIFSSFCIGK